MTYFLLWNMGRNDKLYESERLSSLNVSFESFTEERVSYWFGVNEGIFVFRWIIPLSFQKICELLLFKGQSLLKITDRSSFLWNVLGMCWGLMFDMRVRIWSCWCVEVLSLRISVLCLCSSKHRLKAPVVQPVLWWVLCFKNANDFLNCEESAWLRKYLVRAGCHT